MTNKSINIKEEILKSYDELIPEMQVLTQVEPRLLNENKVRDFLSNSLDRMREETAREVFSKLLRAANEIDESNSLKRFGNNDILAPIYSPVLREIWAVAHAIKEESEEKPKA